MKVETNQILFSCKRIKIQNKSIRSGFIIRKRIAALVLLVVMLVPTSAVFADSREFDIDRDCALLINIQRSGSGRYVRVAISDNNGRAVEATSSIFDIATARRIGNLNPSGRGSDYKEATYPNASSGVYVEATGRVGGGAWSDYFDHQY